jgi:hypothetical protein
LETCSSPPSGRHQFQHDYGGIILNITLNERDVIIRNVLKMILISAFKKG